MEKCSWEPSGLEDEQPDPYTPTPESRPGDEESNPDQHTDGPHTEHSAES